MFCPRFSRCTMCWCFEICIEPCDRSPKKIFGGARCLSRGGGKVYVLAGFPAEKYTLPPRSLFFGSLSKKNILKSGLDWLSWLSFGGLGWIGVSWAGMGWVQLVCVGWEELSAVGLLGWG